MKRKRDFSDWKFELEAKRATARAMTFVCAICQREITPEVHHLYGQLRGRDGHVPPICRPCEYNSHGSYGAYGIGGFQGVPRIRDGAFMDRRIAVQIGALAQALTDEANRQTWSKQYAEGASRGS